MRSHYIEDLVRTGVVVLHAVAAIVDLALRNLRCRWPCRRDFAAILDVRVVVDALMVLVADFAAIQTLLDAMGRLRRHSLRVQRKPTRRKRPREDRCGTDFSCSLLERLQREEPRSRDTALQRTCRRASTPGGVFLAFWPDFACPKTASAPHRGGQASPRRSALMNRGTVHHSSTCVGRALR